MLSVLRDYECLGSWDSGRDWFLRMESLWNVYNGDDGGEKVGRVIV